jgi:glycosidase
MGFHFPIMPRIYMALKKERADDMIEILRRTPPIPENCQWCTFLRNHDELTLEMVTAEERQWMWEQYAPASQMRINLGIRRRLSSLLDNDQRKIELANSLLFTLPGSPIIYYGDEIGMTENLDLPDRNGVRTPMQWDDSPNAGFTAGSPFAPIGENYTRANVKGQVEDPSSLFHSIQKMVQTRKRHPAFGHGAMEWHDVGNPALAIFTRSLSDEQILVVHNLSSAKQFARGAGNAQETYRDLLSDTTLELNDTLTLQPLQFLWLVRETWPRDA